MHETSRKFPSLCYTLQNEIENSNFYNFRYELFLVAEKCLLMCPKISAFDIYDVNRPILCMICSTILTYIIVITQLHFLY